MALETSTTIMLKKVLAVTIQVELLHAQLGETADSLALLIGNGRSRLLVSAHEFADHDWLMAGGTCTREHATMLLDQAESAVALFDGEKAAHHVSIVVLDGEIRVIRSHQLNC